MTGFKRFYWVKLQVATAMYRAEEEELEDVEEKLRSRCFPWDYWSAKNQLDRALEVAANCEKDVDANKPADKHALITLVEAKQGAQELLEEGTAAYEKEWRAKGRDPAPDKDEWQEMEKVEMRGRPHLRSGLWMYETWGRAVPYFPRRQEDEVYCIDLVE